MRVLLDTHIWLWYLLAGERLSDGHRACIQDPENEIWLSPISIWEAHLLIERGRLPIVQPPLQWVSSALQALPVNQAPLTFPIAMRSRQIRALHEDPTDRFLAATAIEMKLVLLTADERLLGCQELHCLT